MCESATSIFRDQRKRPAIKEERDMTIRNHSPKLAISLLLISAVAGCYLPSFGPRRSFAIPNTYPLGSTVRDHYH